VSDAEAKLIRRLAAEADLIRVSPSRFRGCDPLRPLVISVVRNEEPRLADFLDHYRTLGVCHFLFIDNGSTDGTCELLADEPDVDLLATDAPFDAARKHGWITRLIREYGDRWYLLADADEHAVFHGVADLAQVARAAQRLGRRRVRGTLLDMYGDKPLAAASRDPGQPLLAAYPFFDPDGYVEKGEVALTTRTGGPRQRVFSSIDPSFAPQLTKYPLFRLSSEETIVSPHYIQPPTAGDDPCWIALLHFKFDADSRARIADAVERRQYWRDSYEYRVYQEAITQDPNLTFMGERSRRFRGTAELVELGIIEPIRRRRGGKLWKKVSNSLARKMTALVTS
jgi:hypothetical protein